MSQNSQHPNSKKVTIYRAGSFINDAQTNAQDFMALSKKSIGSNWSSSTGKGIGTGLTFAEIDILLPLVLDLPSTDRTFREKVREYFASIITHVAYETGRELEIGLELDNNQPITYSKPGPNGTMLFNLPIDVADYLRYRHAQQHPKVAANKSKAMGDKLKEFYIFDKEDAIRDNTVIAKNKDKALVAYLSIISDPQKVNVMLTLLGTDPRTFKGKNAHSLREQALREKADKSADKFLEVYTQDNFEEKYLLQAMVNSGVLRQISKQYVDASTGEPIGHNLEEAIYFFKDPANNNQISILKSALQDALKELNKSTPAKQAVAEPTKQAVEE